MKKYLAPKIEEVNIRLEESMAVATDVTCKVGECHEGDTPIWLTPGVS